MLGGWVVLFVIVQVILMKMQQGIRQKRAEEDSRMVGALADAVHHGVRDLGGILAARVVAGQHQWTLRRERERLGHQPDRA